MSYYFSRQPDWNSDDIAEVADCLRAGWTSVEIGIRKGVQPGAVQRRVGSIAELAAIGFDRSAINARYARTQSTKVSESAVVKPSDVKALHDAYDLGSLRVPLLNVGTGCTWPVNNPPRGGLFLFCGHDKEWDGTYCAHHQKRAAPLRCTVAGAA